MHRATINQDRTNAGGDKGPGRDDAAWRNDGSPLAVIDSDFSGKLRRDFTKELRLELGEVANRSAHAASCVMFGKAIRGSNVREPWVARALGICIIGTLLFVRHRIRLMSGVE